MNTLALLLDGPTSQEMLLPSCIYAPSFTVLLSWLLMRRKKSLVVVSLALATLSAFFILSPVVDMSVWARKWDQSWHDFLNQIYGVEFTRAIWFAAGFPYVMIALFHFGSKKEPIQPPQTTTGSSAPDRV